MSQYQCVVLIVSFLSYVTPTTAAPIATTFLSTNAYGAVNTQNSGPLPSNISSTYNSGGITASATAAVEPLNSFPLRYRPFLPQLNVSSIVSVTNFSDDVDFATASATATLEFYLDLVQIAPAPGVTNVYVPLGPVATFYTSSPVHRDDGDTKSFGVWHALLEVYEGDRNDAVGEVLRSKWGDSNYGASGGPFWNKQVSINITDNRADRLRFSLTTYLELSAYKGHSMYHKIGMFPGVDESNKPEFKFYLSGNISTPEPSTAVLLLGLFALTCSWRRTNATLPIANQLLRAN